MLFEQIATGGCRSYLIGCAESCAAAVIDPELSQIDRYLALAAHHGLRIRYLLDTHTHADHFSATRELARRLEVPIAMHQASPAPFVDMRVGDGESIVLGKLRINVMHTPGHTRDSMCLRVSIRHSKSIRRTNTRIAATPLSHRSSGRIPACRSALAPSSSR